MKYYEKCPLTANGSNSNCLLTSFDEESWHGETGMFFEKAVVLNYLTNSLETVYVEVCFD